MHIKLSFLLLLVTYFSNAQELIEPCKFGQPLIESLQENYTPSSVLGYSSARDILYSQIDNNGVELSGIYTGFTVILDPSEDPTVSAYQNGSGINAEHVYPQSLGAENEPAKSDLHNIFPCKTNVNSSRGACPFGEIDDVDTEHWYFNNFETSTIPTDNIDAYSEKDVEDCVFEPREEVKGDIARAMFYFFTIYQNEALSASSSYFEEQKQVLHSWHLADPVTSGEIERNDLIEAYQGSFNPFILDASLAWRAFFDEDATYADGDENCYSGATGIESFLFDEELFEIDYNPNSNTLKLNTESVSGSYKIYNLSGAEIIKSNLDSINEVDINDFSRGVYIIKMESQGRFKTSKFLR